MGPRKRGVNGCLPLAAWSTPTDGTTTIVPSQTVGSVGIAVPDHGHRGTELTLVLQGAFTDSTDHFGPGDIEIADEDLDHTPIADDGMDCICLAATDAPLRFRSLMPRLAQPFLRI